MYYPNFQEIKVTFRRKNFTNWNQVKVGENPNLWQKISHIIWYDKVVRMEIRAF